MYYREHNPPHFHARYNEFEALIAIESLSVISGFLPPRVIGLVVEWAAIHRNEILTQWQKALLHEEFDKIEPLR